MLAILTSHPIQYQAPIWRALAADGRVPFKVWFLTPHGVAESNDPGFGRAFSWDIDLLSGYPHCFLEVKEDWNLNRFRGIRLTESIKTRMRNENIDTIWVEGWRFQAIWDVVRAARRCGLTVWMRGESNDLKPDSMIKRIVKRPLLRRYFKRIDHFLCIGSANRRLYQSYGIPADQCHVTPYCVDNDRLQEQSRELSSQKRSIRAKWGIPDGAYCILFCGKFVEKKRPGDLIAAVQMLSQAVPRKPLHLLFVGDGQLAPQLRASCNVVYDGGTHANVEHASPTKPTASFVGFLNQSQIVQAYVAADLLVLPSDSGETWGLVVNEAMACGTPSVVSNLCGCAEDVVVPVDRRLVFNCGDPRELADAIQVAMESPPSLERILNAADTHHLRHTVTQVIELYSRSSELISNGSH